jgi:glycosyltransferase involved in cell wall biosynthesis
MSNIANPTVHILLATYQGAKYLQEQLESIKAQNYETWTLTVSDDGSTDGTLKIVEDFALKQKDHLIRVLHGPFQGVTANFFNLLNVAPLQSKSDLYAFCDQDDVWLPDKLSRAVGWHVGNRRRENLPLLYCSRTQLVNKDGLPVGLSVAPGRPLTFGNSLLQNIASGNTMMLNRVLLDAMRRIPPAHSTWHDWTAYQVVTACGGEVFYDLKPTLLYRQHEANVIGAARRNLTQRALLILQGRYRSWSNNTEIAMQSIQESITQTAQQQLTQFTAARNATNPYMRLRMYLKNKGSLYRQTTLGQLGFLVALLFKLI